MLCKFLLFIIHLKKSMNEIPAYNIFDIFNRPIRGMSAVVIGAGPAHALYFSTYEFSKDSLSQMTNQRHKHFVYGKYSYLFR